MPPQWRVFTPFPGKSGWVEMFAPQSDQVKESAMGVLWTLYPLHSLYYPFFFKGTLALPLFSQLVQAVHLSLPSQGSPWNPWYSGSCSPFSLLSNLSSLLGTSPLLPLGLAYLWPNNLVTQPSSGYACWISALSPVHSLLLLLPSPLLVLPGHLLCLLTPSLSCSQCQLTFTLFHGSLSSMTQAAFLGSAEPPVKCLEASCFFPLLDMCSWWAWNQQFLQGSLINWLTLTLLVRTFSLCWSSFDLSVP